MGTYSRVRNKIKEAKKMVKNASYVFIPQLGMVDAVLAAKMPKKPKTKAKKKTKAKRKK